MAYLTTGPLPGTPPVSLGNNFSNYHSAAQREDVLTYVQYDWNVNDSITWSNQAYYHNNAGRGVVAGPVNNAGLPALFAAYYPTLVVGGSATSAGTLQNIVNVFGGTGYEVRTTEYRDNRAGLRSTFDWQLGDHQIEAGLWYEHNASSQHRRWYPFSAANDDLTPYEIPINPNFTQYYFEFRTDDVQLHLQDQWRILPSLLLQVGVKASLQTASDTVPVEQVNLPSSQPAGRLSGRLAHLEQLVAAANRRDLGRDRKRTAVLQRPEKHAPVHPIRRGQQLLRHFAMESRHPGRVRPVQTQRLIRKPHGPTKPARAHSALSISVR